MGFKWVCPECKARFPWKDGKSPRCPECGYSIDMPETDIPAMPWIAKPKYQTPDMVYRAEEAASIRRAEMAAEITGSSVSDMSAMVQTNMESGLREGDVATKVSPDNASVQAMQQWQQARIPIGTNANEAALAFSSTVSTGPYPNAGARTQALVRQSFAGHLAKFGVPDRNTRSDMPALETLHPLYQRRV